MAYWFMAYSLKDKVVVITGASSGIGKALAFDALQRGAYIAVCGRSIERLTATFSNVEDSRVLCIAADVSNQDDCEQLAEKVVAKWGRVDVLINNAGISMRALFKDVDVSVLRELMDINFFGAVYCTKYLLPHIMKQKGVIAGISSIAGYRGLPARTGYSASKFALQGFLEALRSELLHTGTHVMWVSPGFTASNIRNVARAANGDIQKETPLDEQKLMTAEECSTRILDAIEKRKRSVIMTIIGRMTVFVNKFLPSFVDKRVYQHFLNEPDSPLREI